ncbi:hypothetical protein COV11_03615 [Candidatus Woesearchaeota archaeon CG10_big_fil_rev_8_21_14_0_10_30_7]|nr:MAG: hypothetical protein COV11_03615 [Candidatus Woesearchaeota archaeon CG10_big_fil_rev_8_21_14_0_10_30_7]
MVRKHSFDKSCNVCNSHAKKIPFEYNQITPYIHIGSNMCCKGAFQKSLLKKNIKADLSLENEELDQPWGVDMFLWLPTKDHYPPNKNQVKMGVNFLTECVKNKQKVYVHCKRGHTRAPTMVIAYLISTGIQFKRALEQVKKKRKVTHLSQKQIIFLKQLEKEYENK